MDAPRKLQQPGIKPKVEPCEERSPPLPPAWASEDDWEVTPLSGDQPFFTTVMSRSQVQQPFQLVIPIRFHRHLPAARLPAVLLCHGRSWTMRYCGVSVTKFRRLHAGWRDFAADNGLRVGDACVFELIAATGTGTEEKVVFRVQVLRGGLPEEITSRGGNPDEPLVIVD